MINDKKIKIREAELGELEEVAELKIKLGRYERKFDRELKIWSKKTIVNHLKKDVLGKNKGKIFVAVDEGARRVVGYCTGWVQSDDWPWIEYKGTRLGYVCDCFVLNEYRGRRIGSNLVKETLKWLKSKKVKAAYLDVYLKNKRAYYVWKALGFRELEMTMRKVIR